MTWQDRLAMMLVILTAILAIVTAAYAWLTWGILRTMQEEARRSATAAANDLLWRLLMEYRSAQMLVAIDTLWSLRRRNDSTDNMTNEYEQIRQDDAEQIAALSPQKHAEAASGTLHHRRRMVSYFYQFLAAARAVGALPDHVLYSHWVETDLRIIPEVLIPIEKRLAKELNTESEASRAILRRLEKLHEDSKKRVITA